MSSSTIGNGGESGSHGRHSRQDSESQRGIVDKFHAAMRAKRKQSTEFSSEDTTVHGDRTQRSLDRQNEHLTHQPAELKESSDHTNSNARGLDGYEQTRDELSDRLKELDSLIAAASKIDSRIGPAKDFLEFARNAVSDAETTSAATKSGLHEKSDETARERLAALKGDLEKATAEFDAQVQNSATARRNINSTQVRLQEILTYLDQHEGTDSAARILATQQIELQLSKAARDRVQLIQDSLKLS